MGELLNKAFIDELTDEEEATLARLEQEWLMMCRANDLQDFDFWTVPVNLPIIKSTSLN
jgi:hypothetical protein